MKKALALFTSTLMLVEFAQAGQAPVRSLPQRRPAAATAATAQKATAATARPKSYMPAGMAYYRKGDFKNAAAYFYKVAFGNTGVSSANDKMMAKYYLGISLMKLKMYQTAAFPLIIVTKDAPHKVSQKAFENLVIVSENLNDSTLLDYTLKRLNASELSEIAKELYYNRMATLLMKEKQYDQAISNLKQSLAISPDNDETLYTMGLVYLKQNNTADALPPLEKLYDKYYKRPSTDPKRGLAAMAIARAYYQAKRFGDATNIYREIPKDHPLYRQAQKELTWALFRQAKFRSAMSAIQTLHTPFYENFYDPESLILRSIILLFICQNEEVDKALNTFQRTYTTTYGTLTDINGSSQSPDFFYNQLSEAQNYLKNLKRGERANYNGRVPFFLVRTTLEEAPIKNRMTYIDKIQQEKLRGSKLFGTARDAELLKYSNKILNERLKNSGRDAGTALSHSLIAKEQELGLFTGDLSMLQYEVLNGKKVEARSKYIQSVNKSSSADQINSSASRDFYVKNGYRYWPFDGEYWRDEIGNYQYLGVNRCAANE